MTTITDPTPVHAAVREHYADRARAAQQQASACCGPQAADCCTTEYNVELLAGLPADVTSFSLGCGNPITAAKLQAGETVLDLGSGGGLDCFLAARQVGEAGHVIGVDMTPEMLAKAREAAARLKAANVEFRHGFLETLPVEPDSVDVVISNCVINLSPDKPRVFREILRVLKPGGRLAVSDIVINGSQLQAPADEMESWSACVAGALDVRDFERGLVEAGFQSVSLTAKDVDIAATAGPAGVPFSAIILAHKPQA